MSRAICSLILLSSLKPPEGAGMFDFLLFFNFSRLSSVRLTETSRSDMMAKYLREIGDSNTCSALKYSVLKAFSHN